MKISVDWPGFPFQPQFTSFVNAILFISIDYIVSRSTTDRVTTKLAGICCLHLPISSETTCAPRIGCFLKFYHLWDIISIKDWGRNDTAWWVINGITTSNFLVVIKSHWHSCLLRLLLRSTICDEPSLEIDGLLDCEFLNHIEQVLLLVVPVVVGLARCLVRFKN